MYIPKGNILWYEYITEYSLYFVSQKFPKISQNPGWIPTSKNSEFHMSNFKNIDYSMIGIVSYGPMS